MNNCLDCGKGCTGKRCKECYIKHAGNHYKFGQWEFNTNKELEKEIKKQLHSLPINIESTNEFLKTFIETYHEDVRRRGYIISKFKILDWNGQVGKWAWCRDRFRGGIYVLAFFEPINEWHGVTVYAHKRNFNPKQKFINALRQKWSEKAPRRDRLQTCEKCGAFPVELHHSQKPFKELVEIALKEFTSEELKRGLDDDWWLHESEADALPDDHPAVIKIHELHEGLRYKWLCFRCHREEEAND